MNGPMTAKEASYVLWADGVAPRKRQVAPNLSNQQWPDFVSLAQATLLEKEIRLEILEELVYSPVALYAKDLKLLYEQRVKEAADAHRWRKES